MRTPSQGYLDWRANLKPGYYWIENTGWDDTPVRRILHIVEIVPHEPSYSDEPNRYGYWAGQMVKVGLYVLNGARLETPEGYCSHWEGFRAEPVKPMSQP